MCVLGDPQMYMLRRVRWCPCNVLPSRMITVAPNWSGSITSTRRWSCPACHRQSRDRWRCWCTADVWWSSTLLWATREITPVLWGKVQSSLLMVFKNTKIRIWAGSLKPFHEWFDRNGSGQSWFRLTVNTTRTKQYNQICHVQNSCALKCPDYLTPAENISGITSVNITWHKVCRCSSGQSWASYRLSLICLVKSCFVLLGWWAVTNEQLLQERGGEQQGCLHVHQILSLSGSVMSHDLHRAARCPTKRCAHSFTEVLILS